MRNIISADTEKYCRAIFSRINNGYASTKGMQGPVVQDAVSKISGKGLQRISQRDEFFRQFSTSNPNIASVSERWYGTDVAQRAILENASDRYRYVVDMSRNNNGGLLRAIFDKFGKLKKTLSIAKDGSSVETLYSRGTKCSTGVPYLSKKVVRGSDGLSLREVYQATAEHNPNLSYTFAIDAKTGLKETIKRPQLLLIAKEGKGFETYMPSATGIQKQRAYPVGVDQSIRNTKENLYHEGWIRFLERKISEMCNRSF